MHIKTFPLVSALALVAAAKSAHHASTHVQASFDYHISHTCQPRNFSPFLSAKYPLPQTLSHSVGIVQTAPTGLILGPDSGIAASGANTWTVSVPYPLPDTKYLVLHFDGVQLPGNNRIEVPLGYATDVFVAADGCSFWTRPIDVKSLAGAPVVIKYVVSGGAAGGIAKIDKIATGLRQHGIQDPTAYSNSDPFFQGTYLEGTYDPFWFCTGPPKWENVACVADGNDVRSRVARSVGMIVMPSGEDSGTVSTCTVTLIAPDQVITAGHCIDDDAAALASSVIFNYQTDCSGNRLPGSKPTFCKVAEMLCRGWSQGVQDYAILRLAEAPVGVPAIPLRTTPLATSESVFGIHHPYGAVKKLSIPHPNFVSVTSPGPDWIRVPRDLHVTGGSSGSGIFDLSGRFVGILSDGAPCSGFNLRYFPSTKVPTGSCTPKFPPREQCAATCPTCNASPGLPNQCDSSAPCSNTPFGTMCGCRPGYKAEGGDSVGIRLNWPVAGHEHRVYVPPGVSCNALCNEWYLGGEGCKEVPVRSCS